MLTPTIICLGVALILVMLSYVLILSVLSEAAKQDEHIAKLLKQHNKKDE
jgi:hypothetical protein